MFEAFKEDVTESFCEYNIGSMQKGCEVQVQPDDAHELLRLIQALKPGEALVVIKTACGGSL